MKIISHPQLEEDLRHKRPVLFAHWHGDILAIVSFAKFYRVVSIASVSSDGEIITRVLERLGLKMARGSSSKKGASGLRNLLRSARENYVPVVPVDGPRGPRHVPKPGIFELSKILQARIYPAGIASSSHFTFQKSWDKSRLPKPFAQVILRWGDPLEALSESEDPRNPELARKLTEKLSAAGILAEDSLKALHSPLKSR